MHSVYWLYCLKGLLIACYCWSPFSVVSLHHTDSPPTQVLWPTGWLRGWPVGLEFPAGQLAESGYWREQFQTISEDILFTMY